MQFSKKKKKTVIYLQKTSVYFTLLMLELLLDHTLKTFTL